MSPFEYVIVLISIILGLGVTQIMTGVAELVHQWDRVRLYWPHMIWIVLVFVLHIQEWWDVYSLQSFSAWRLPTFLFFTLYPVNLFILARILFPFQPNDGDINLKDFYFANFKKFFLWTIILNVLSIISNLIVHGFDYSLFLIVAIMATLATVILRNYKMEWLHQTIAVVFLLTLILSAIVNWDEWLIN